MLSLFEKGADECAIERVAKIRWTQEHYLSSDILLNKLQENTISSQTFRRK